MLIKLPVHPQTERKRKHIIHQLVVPQRKNIFVTEESEYLGGIDDKLGMTLFHIP